MIQRKPPEDNRFPDVAVALLDGALLAGNRCRRTIYK